jgi:hypothetical protein
MKFLKTLPHLFASALLLFAGYQLYLFFFQVRHENAVLKQVIERLEADSRVAEVIVVKAEFDEQSRQTKTTIKFLEYDAAGKPLEPKYFTFTGNILQFQSLVVRFADVYVRGGDRLRGKSAYLFWKIFMLNGKNTEEYDITPVGKIPDGYRVQKERDTFEERLWEKFWTFALDPRHAAAVGVKNAQIEAPGTAFVPGILYTVRIEHDGGLRIDAKPLSPILRNEKIL